MGGIHATFCREEALEYVDAVVTGEAESVWEQVLADAHNHALRRVYDGSLSAMDAIPSLETTRTSRGGRTDAAGLGGDTDRREPGPSRLRTSAQT